MPMWTPRLPALGRNVWLLLVVTVIAYGGLNVFALALNLYLAAIGFREDFIGVVSFVSVAATAGCAVPAGYLSNRIGARTCILASAVVMGGSFAATALTVDPYVILVSGALGGVGQALLFVPSAPFLMDNAAPPDRLQVWSLNFAATAVGAMGGSVVAGYLPGILAPDAMATAHAYVLALRYTLVVGAATVAVGALPMLFVAGRRARSTPLTGALQAEAPVDPRLARTIIIQSAISVVLLALGTGVVLPFYNVYLVEQMGLSVAEVGVVFAVGSLLMVPGTLLGPALGRRLGVVKGIAVARTLTVPFFALLAVIPSPGLGITAFIVRAGLMSATWPLDNAFIMDLVGPRSRAILAGTRSASWNLGWSVSSLAAGQAIVHTGYWSVFVASTIMVGAGILYHYRTFLRREPPRA